MKKLQCSNCTAPIEWDGQSEMVICPYCGTKYRMQRASATRNAAPEVLHDCVGRGKVALIPSMLANTGNACFVSTYVPEGWVIRCGGSPQGYGDPARDGAHITTTIGHPQERAFFIARSGQTVRHVEPSIMNRTGARYLNTAGVMYGTGGGLEGTCRSAAEYEDEMVLEVLKGASLKLLREEDADESEKKLAEQIISGFSMQGYTATVDWKRRYYLVTLPDGKKVNAAAETRIVAYEQGNAGGGMFGGFQGMLQNGGMFGGLQGMIQNGMKRMQSAFRQRFWEVQYELLFLANADYAREAWPEFVKVRSSFQYLPAFEQYKAGERQVVMQCINQMAADRAASEQCKAGIMMDAQNHIHNTMSSMQQSASATNDRVAGMWSDAMRTSGSFGGGYGQGGYGSVSSQDAVTNRYSEMIKETNTYYGNDGNVYEASTEFDNIYQGNRDQDSFVGTSDTTWDPGVDFDELKRTDGKY